MVKFESRDTDNRIAVLNPADPSSTTEPQFPSPTYVANSSLNFICDRKIGFRNTFRLINIKQQYEMINEA